MTKGKVWEHLFQASLNLLVGNSVDASTEFAVGFGIVIGGISVVPTTDISTDSRHIAIFSGICCITSPKSSLPLACLLRLTPSLPQVPHCLKKKAAPCRST